MAAIELIKTVLGVDDTGTSFVQKIIEEDPNKETYND